MSRVIFFSFILLILAALIQSSYSRRRSSSSGGRKPSVRRPNYPRQPEYQPPAKPQPNYPRQPSYQPPAKPQPNYPRQPSYQPPAIPQPNYPRQPTFRVPNQEKPKIMVMSNTKPKNRKPKKNSFNKGKYNLAKITLATYLLTKTKPNIGFRPNRRYDRNKRPTRCYDCISFNGNNERCENEIDLRRPGLDVSTCKPTVFKPYCSVEHGITGDNQTYVRRSCNDKLCESCKTQRGDATAECYVVDCDLCHWNNCNNQHLGEIFQYQSTEYNQTEEWSGDDESDNVESTTSGESKTALVENRAFILIMVITISLLL